MILAFSFAIAPKTNAAVNWADYFTKDEATTIKKMVDTYIRGQIDDNAKNWKGLIGSKQVDDSIAKRKVYTGTIANDISIADKTAVDDENYTYYFKLISVPEFSLDSDASNIVIYINDNRVSRLLGETVWVAVGGSYTNLKNGYVWINYASKSESGNPSYDVSDYKIIVTY